VAIGDRAHRTPNDRDADVDGDKLGNIERSTSIRRPADAAAHARRLGHRLIVANSRPILPRMLGLLGFDDALEVAAGPRRTPPLYACTLRAGIG